MKLEPNSLCCSPKETAGSDEGYFWIGIAETCSVPVRSKARDDLACVRSFDSGEADLGNGQADAVPCARRIPLDAYESTAPRNYTSISRNSAEMRFS